MHFEEKIALNKALFSSLYDGEIQCFKSPLKAYRTRAEFSIYHHENGEISYAMFKNKKKTPIEKFDIADEKIQEYMPILLNNLNENLKHKLFGVEFLATKLDLSATLLYHKNIETIIHDLQELSTRLNLKLIARSRGKKLVFNGENLRQILNINTNEFLYEFNNDCFIQPNTTINEKMIEWVVDLLEKEDRKDLLELYCGYGNFTIVLAKYFNKILATEISKKNIEFALKNCTLNSIGNISFTRLSSEELSQALKKEREFNRLKGINLDSFSISHVLVDPPRAGLDLSVIELIKNYENIIYISCNPISLRENLKKLCKTHKISKFAFFDQFANTNHLECGIYLKLNNNIKH
ncbi:tRNA m5U54 methyltransferase [Campylobacter subantarcticus LMG 24377]|uniref:tRNA (Uridine(54)-C5)-methyltransferase TrmA n=1 Tax=Campylobacter subantarcticus TaxID=497724 RepID=A0ABW9N482_9BACT|nr:tRNA (uridine(54)-C5)-methyltransferase TrmA [Campylobacter subantarcticus]AJC92747.1 tRNA m5U54 methyltransferase [Campylobacter subantarcticus LMG 24377]EAL3938170.1 tRNA (uridine(54)-C5)-methyltransferase TrmA [Campylobacter lari]MPB99096.1 tRNA (uridine(54)-C5)-methyltransferase TrmA [Campylobacter subantarcticus]